jgi:AcrR family transcriptional regulator
MSKRHYNLGLRKEAQTQTRNRILEAASTLFAREGLHAVSIAAVAREADVGRTTVFEHFRSKKGLLEGVQEALGEQHQRDELVAAVLQSPPPVALHQAFTLGCPLWSREAPLRLALVAAAAADVEVRAVLDEKEQGRRMLVDALAKRLDEAALLPDGASLDTAADLLWVLTSFESFHTLHHRGLPVPVAADRLWTLARSALLRPEALAPSAAAR